MTEDELVDDLSRLLREGLVYVYVGQAEEAIPRFAVTARGRDLSSSDQLFQQPDGSPLDRSTPACPQTGR